MGICTHSVAVAELSSKLPEFVAWFKRTKKCPNLSKFAEATMPTGRGKKGSENLRKRKAPSETETRIVNPFTVSQQVSSQPSVSATTVLSASASSEASSFPLNVSQTNSVHLPSQSNIFHLREGLQMYTSISTHNVFGYVAVGSYHRAFKYHPKSCLVLATKNDFVYFFRLTFPDHFAIHMYHVLCFFL